MAASEERRRLLREVIKAIEEDVELRYTLMGLLGFRELLERFTRLEERQQRLERKVEEAYRVSMVVAHRFGVLSEEAFREAMRYVIEEVFGTARVERWVYRDEEGFVYGFPAVVEVDVLIRDSEHVLLEVKSRVSVADVAKLYKAGLLYEKVEGRRPRLAIVGGVVDGDAARYASRLGVGIIRVVGEPGARLG